MTNVHALPNQQVLLTTLPLDMTSTANLVAAVKATAIGCSTDQVREILTNVLVIVGDGEMKFVATNSYMLFVTSIGGIEMPAGYHAEFMIKGKQLVAAMPKAKALVQLIIDHDSLIIHDPINRTDTQLRMQEGTFPNWQNLIAEDKALTAARLALIKAMALTIASGLEIFGVEPVEEMR